MDDISITGGPEEVKKGIRKCARMEVEKKMKYSLSKTKYMVVKTGKEKEEDISEQVKAGNIQRTKKYKYLGITINEEGNLKGHIEELKQKCEAISREIEIIGSRNQVGKEEIRVQLKLFEACFMPALIYGIEAWGCIKKEEMKEIERIQGKALKRIFKLPVSTAYTGILMETGIWPAEQRIQYATLMLYHNIKNSDEERKIKKMIEEQEKKNYNNTFYKKVQQIAETLEIEIDKATGKKKSSWEK